MFAVRRGGSSNHAIKSNKVSVRQLWLETPAEKAHGGPVLLTKIRNDGPDLFLINVIRGLGTGQSHLAIPGGEQSGFRG